MIVLNLCPGILFLVLRRILIGLMSFYFLGTLDCPNLSFKIKCFAVLIYFHFI
jgi:hypothetical protein